MPQAYDAILARPPSLVPGDGQLVTAGDEVAHRREIALPSRHPVREEAEHGAPERADEQSPEHQTEPLRARGEQADQQSDEQAEPGTARRSGTRRGRGGE